MASLLETAYRWYRYRYRGILDQPDSHTVSHAYNSLIFACIRNPVQPDIPTVLTCSGWQHMLKIAQPLSR